MCMIYILPARRGLREALQRLHPALCSAAAATAAAAVQGRRRLPVGRGGVSAPPLRAVCVQALDKVCLSLPVQCLTDSLFSEFVVYWLF